MNRILPPTISLTGAIKQILLGLSASAGLMVGSAWAGPDGGRVVDGDASIEQSGNTTTIRQQSRRTVIDWRDFSIDQHERVDFIQPDSSAIALNRVTGSGISYIDGALGANGKVFIINGNGIVFGESAQIDVNALVASTFDIRNEDFMRGEFDFNLPGKAGASIKNYGTISVAEAGLAAFVAPYVENHGLIYARYGRVALGASEVGFALDLYGDELIRLAVSDQLSERLGLLDEPFGIANDGSILADGGSIVLTAETASEVLSDIITVGGELRADSIGMQDGAIVLSGRDGGVLLSEDSTLSAENGYIEIAAANAMLNGQVSVSGDSAGDIVIDANWINVGGALEANGETGGRITLNADDIVTAGSIAAQGVEGDGGEITLHADQEIIQTNTTTINASGSTNGGEARMTAGEQITTSARIQSDGKTGVGGNIDVSAPVVKSLSAHFLARGGTEGGRVRLGGEFQGGKSLSEDELPNAETLILSSGSLVDVSGQDDDGGEAVLWSDEYTVFQGRIIGEGAKVEVSSSGRMHYDGEVSIGAGELLLDPKNIIINDGSIPTSLNLILGVGYDYDESLGASDNYGAAVALDGTHLAVGAPGDDGSAGGSADAGAVYLYTFANTDLDNPSLSAIVGEGYTGGNNVDVSNIEAGDEFGYSVALDGGLLAVGAVGDDGFNNPFNLDNSGAVYLYSFTGDFTSITQETIMGYDYGGFGAAENLNDVILIGDDRLGSSVAIDGTHLAIASEGDDGFGATYTDPGNVYLFSFTGDFASLNRESVIGDYATAPTGNGFEYFNIGPDLGGSRYANDSDNFGSALALDGNLLAVGASGDDGQGNTGTNTGAVYLYSFDNAGHEFDNITLESVIGSDYSTRAEDLDNTNLADGDEFGSALSLVGTELVVGAPQDQSGRGAVYRYSFTGDFTSITDEGRIGFGFVGASDLELSGLISGDNFGRSVSQDGSFLAVGASGDDGFGDPGTANASGAVYVFINDRVEHDFAWGFSDSTGNTSIIDVNDLTTLLDAGTAVTLQASNDITVETAVAVNNAGGDGGTIIFQAGRSITVEDDITTDNAAITLVANEIAANGVVDADRDAGAASITFTTGSVLDAGTGAVTLTLADGVGNTNNTVGAISLDAITAGSLTINNANTGSSITDNAVLIIAGITDINASGADVTLDFASNDFDSDDSGDALTIDAAAAEIFDVDQLEIGTSNVASLVAESGGDMTLSGTVTASSDLGDGNNTAIVLATGANFTEEVGADLNPGTGRFIVYSANPSSDSLDDLAATPWYNTIYDNSNPTNVTGTGDRFAYSQTATLVVSADDLSRDYGDANPTFTQSISGYVNSETSAILSGSEGNGSSAAIATTAAGSATITATAGTISTDRNYTITTSDGTLTIDPRPIIVTADLRTRDYGDTLTLGTTAFTVDDMANSETIGSVTLTSASGNATDASAGAGTYAGDIAPSAATGGSFTASNYDVTYANADLVIDPIALIISADPEIKTYDGIAFTGGTLGYAGFVNGESSADLGGTLSFASGTSEGAVNAGSYTIQPRGQTSSNYTISYVDSTLTINERAITVIANDRSRTYGDAITLGTSEFQQPTNMVTGETIGAVTLTSTGSFDSDTTAAAGAYVGDIQPSAATGGSFTASNYDITYQAGDLTVDARPITITADSRSRDYGSTLALGTSAFSVDDLANGETIGGVTLSSNANIDTDTTVNAGTYLDDIVPASATGGTFSASNYLITYEAGDFTIDPVALTVTASSEIKTYDGIAFTGGTLGYAGFVNGETSADLGGTLSFASGTSEGAVDVGSYTIQPRGQVSGNYIISYLDSTLSINQRPIDVIANDRSRTFGDTLVLGTTQFQQPTNMAAGETIGEVALTSLSGNDLNAAAPEGTYIGDIEPSGATGGTFNPNNYAITYINGDLIVGLATLTITADSQSRIYGDAIDLGSTLFSSVGLVNGDVIDAVSLSSATGIDSDVNADVGTYVSEILISNATGASFDAGNYTIVYEAGDLNVEARPLTVTANPRSRTYGSTLDLGNSAFASSGLVNGNTLDSVSFLSAGNLDSDTAANVGTYVNDITIAGLTGGGGFNAANYAINFVAGDFTVDPASLTVSANIQSRAYGDTINLGTTSFSAAGLQNGEVIDAVVLTSGTGIDVNTNADAGTYVDEIQISSASGASFDENNYSVTYQAADLVVDPRLVALSADEVSKFPSEPDPSLSVNLTSGSLANSDSLQDVTGALSRELGEEPGAYDILLGNGANASNYTIAFNADNNAFAILFQETTPDPVPDNDIEEEQPDEEVLPDTDAESDTNINLPPVVVERDDPNTGTVVITVDQDSQVVGAIVLPDGNGEVVIETESKQPLQTRPRALPPSRFHRNAKKKKSPKSGPAPVTAQVIIEGDGGLAIDLSDGRRISGISTPAATFSEKGTQLILERDRGVSSTPVGLATTISVVELPSEGEAEFIQHMLVFDEEKQMMLMNFGGAGRPPLNPGRSQARVKFGLADAQGNQISFIAIMTENGVVVRPQGEIATWLSQGSDDVVPALALLALQSQLDANIDDIVAVYLVR